MIVLRVFAIFVLAAVAGLLNAARAKMPLVPDYDRIRAVEKIARDGTKIKETPGAPPVSSDPGTTSNVVESNENASTAVDSADADPDRAADLAAIEEFKAHYENGGLVIDARPAGEFEKGHLSAPMVINVPSDDYLSHLDFLYSFQASPIFIYCTSKKCDMAEDLKYSLEQLGFMDLHVFKLGWDDGIKKYKLPSATGPALLGE